MQSLFLTLLFGAALFAGLWHEFRQLYYPPGDWIGAALISFFAALGIGALRKAWIERRDERLIKRAGETPHDGERIALTGTLEAQGELLRAPFSGEACLVYDYSISHLKPARRSKELPTRIYDRSGLALAPCAIRSSIGVVYLLRRCFAIAQGVFARTGNYPPTTDSMTRESRNASS